VVGDYKITKIKEVRERFELPTSGFAGPRTTGLYYLTAVKKIQNQQLTL
tara:strand:+ start:244 stop:390 length:147 start_codon:yes stop_codon:yes gene_type:complete